MTVYRSTPRSTVYHWKHGEGPHQTGQWDWARNHRDRLRRERNEIWSDCGRRLPDDPSTNMYAEEGDIGSEQWCSGPGCGERWYRWERAQRARASDRATRAVEETRQRLVEVHERRNARGDAAGRPEGVRDLPGPGSAGGVAGREGGGLPGSQEPRAVQGYVATNPDHLNGVRIGGVTVGTVTNAAVYWSGVANTITTQKITPTPRTPCVCGEITNALWIHGQEECTWKEDQRV